MNVVTLRDHLRAHEQVKFALVERVERPLEIFVAANRISIETPDARLRKQAVQQLFQLLRSGSEKINILTAALPADLRHRRHESAVVADHAIGALMMGHCDGAVSGFHPVPTSAAQGDSASDSVSGLQKFDDAYRSIHQPLTLCVCFFGT